MAEDKTLGETIQYPGSQEAAEERKRRKQRVEEQKKAEIQRIVKPSPTAEETLGERIGWPKK